MTGHLPPETNFIVGVFSPSTNDSYYTQIRPRVLDDLPTVTRSESALSRGEWESFFDVDGRMSDESGFRATVFRNGVEHDIRPEVWKFLLGYFDAALTHVERAEFRSKRVSEAV